MRLDRALANHEWLTKFPGAKLHHIAMSTFDHHLLVLLFPNVRSRSQSNGKLLMFEEIWLQVPRCNEVVQEASKEDLYK